MSMGTPTDHEASLASLLREIRSIPVVGRRLADDMNSGGHRSTLRGAGIEFGEVREYVEGDDPRGVDASVSARMGRLFVKRFIDERERTALVMLDVGHSMDCGFGEWSLRDAGIRVMAAMVWSVIENQDRAGLLTFGGDACRWIEPHKGPAHFIRLAQWAIAAPQGVANYGLDAGLDLARQRLTRRSLVVIVTDGIQESNISRLARLSARHDVIAVKLLPPERTMPHLGKITIRDPRTGRISEIDTNQQSTRSAWHEAWKVEDDAFMSATRRAGADPVLIPVPSRPDTGLLLAPLVSLFTGRSTRGVRS